MAEFLRTYGIWIGLGVIVLAIVLSRMHRQPRSAMAGHQHTEPASNQSPVAEKAGASSHNHSSHGCCG